MTRTVPLLLLLTACTAHAFCQLYDASKFYPTFQDRELLYEGNTPLYKRSAEFAGCVHGDCREGQGVYLVQTISNENKKDGRVTSFRMTLHIYYGQFHGNGRYFKGRTNRLNYTSTLEGDKLVPYTYFETSTPETYLDQFASFEGEFEYSKGDYQRKGWGKDLYVQRNGRKAMIVNPESRYVNDRRMQTRWDYISGHHYLHFEGWAIGDDIPLIGKMTLTNGSTYHGALLNDVFHGPGRLVQGTTVNEGIWRNGELTEARKLPFTNAQLAGDISKEANTEWTKVHVNGKEHYGYLMDTAGMVLLHNGVGGYTDRGTLYVGEINDGQASGTGYFLKYGSKQTGGTPNFYEITEEHGQFAYGGLNQGLKAQHRLDLLDDVRTDYAFSLVNSSEQVPTGTSKDVTVQPASHIPGDSYQQRFEYASKLQNEKKYQEAIAAFLTLANDPDESLLMPIYLNIGLCYGNLGDFQKANHYAQLGIMEDPSSTIAYLVRSLLLFANNEIEGGRDYFKRAALLNTERQPLIDACAYFDDFVKEGINPTVMQAEKQWALGYINSFSFPLRGMVNDFVAGLQAVQENKLDVAKGHFNKAMASNGFAGEAAFLKGTFYYQAASHFVLREKWLDAVPFLENALTEFAKQPFSGNALFHTRGAKFLAQAYAGEQFNTEKGLTLLLEQAAHVQALPQEQRVHQADYYTYMAELAAAFPNKLVDARQYALQVINLGQDFRNSDYYLAKAYNTVGSSYLYSTLPAERTKLREAFDKGLQHAQSAGSKDMEMIIRSNYGASLYTDGKVGEAVKILEETVEYAVGNGNFLNAETGLNNIGALLFQDKQYQAAIPYFKRAIAITDDHLAKYQGEEKLHLRHSRASAYQFLSLCHAAINDTKGLYEAQNKERTQQLAETINSGAVRASSTLADYQKLLKPGETALIYSQGQPGEVAVNIITASSVKAIHSRNFTPFNLIKEKYLDRIQAHTQSRPGYKPAGIYQVGNQLYVSTQENKVDQNDWEEIMEFARELLQQPANADLAFILTDMLRAYHEVLIKPILPQLSGTKSLVIFPDGILNFLPFESLLDGQGRHLVEQFDIRYGQSPEVSLLISQRQHGERAKSLLAMGGAIYEEMSERADAVRSVNRLVGLQNLASVNIQQNKPQREVYAALGFGKMDYLQGTLIEVQTVAGIFGDGADVYTGTDMTENRLKTMNKSGALKQYKTIHLATHGFALTEIPQLSGLAMCIFEKMQDGEDGYLTAAEIASLELAADLAVLSACETGLGKIYGGEGVSGLTNAFLVAGADRALVSLWPVSDAGTMYFMVGMYELVEKHGMDYETAINDMKRRFIKGEFGAQFSGPDIWAPFILNGR